jgi:hydrogenase maturation protease
MQKLMNVSKLFKCPHTSLANPDGIALITFGNSLRGDDGIASALCDILPANTLKTVCRFDLGSYTGFLADCIANHKAAIIVDATKNDNTIGTISILDLNAVLDKKDNLNLKASHGVSFLDELRLARVQNNLPKRIILFGVEIGNTNWQEKLSPELQKIMPALSTKLSYLITIVLEALQHNA